MQIGGDGGGRDTRLPLISRCRGDKEMAPLRVKSRMPSRRWNDRRISVSHKRFFAHYDDFRPSGQCAMYSNNMPPTCRATRASWAPSGAGERATRAHEPKKAEAASPSMLRCRLNMHDDGGRAISYLSNEPRACRGKWADAQQASARRAAPPLILASPRRPPRRRAQAHEPNGAPPQKAAGRSITQL